MYIQVNIIARVPHFFGNNDWADTTTCHYFLVTAEAYSIQHSHCRWFNTMRLCIITKLHHCHSKALHCILGGLLLLAPGFIDCFCFNKVRSTSTLNNLNVTSEIYLFSLRWPDDTLKFSKAVKDVWRWKDSVLGDGRDFFVPKPKTLTALNRHLVDSCDCIGECSVFSNCARFEVIVWCPERIDSDVIRNQVSQTLAAQVQAHRNRTTFSILQDQIARFDSPKSIHVHALPCNDDIIVKEISNHWDVFSGVQVICHHLALVAAGMATRPNRPDKLVSFRPFSSRDAHILLQLKRTPTVDRCCTSRRKGSTWSQTGSGTQISNRLWIWR